MLSAWLVIIIAALIVLCLSFFFQAQGMESRARARELLAQEEVQQVEAALRESQARYDALQSEPIVPPPLPARPPADDLHAQILRLRRGGMSALRIAQELALPLSAVETIIALRDSSS